MIDELDRWLEPLSDDEPCGEDLEYDPEFMALEREAQPKEEQVMGDEVLEAEEPDWRDLVGKAEALFDRHRDLRTAFHYGRALLRTRGFLHGLSVIEFSQRLLEQFWDSVHPQLDPDDDNDPTARINVLAGFADSTLFLTLLRTTPFIESRMAGNFSLRDLRIAKGDLTPKEGETAHSMALIEGAIRELDPEQLNSTIQAVEWALASAVKIEEIFREKTGDAGPDLSPLETDLKEVLAALKGGVVEGEAADDGGEDAGSGGGGGGKVSAPGAINSRHDASRLLDTVCVWFENHEPSSPVPLLLRRAQRLVGKNFLDLIEDVAPDGYDQFKRLAKIPEPEDNDDDD